MPLRFEFEYKSNFDIKETIESEDVPNAIMKETFKNNLFDKYTIHSIVSILQPEPILVSLKQGGGMPFDDDINNVVKIYMHLGTYGIKIIYAPIWECFVPYNDEIMEMTDDAFELWLELF